jgi:hypothetical protein
MGAKAAPELAAAAGGGVAVNGEVAAGGGVAVGGEGAAGDTAPTPTLSTAAVGLLTFWERLVGRGGGSGGSGGDDGGGGGGGGGWAGGGGGGGGGEGEGEGDRGGVHAAEGGTAEGRVEALLARGDATAAAVLTMGSP